MARILALAYCRNWIKTWSRMLNVTMKYRVSDKTVRMAQDAWAYDISQRNAYSKEVARSKRPAQCDE